MGCKGIFYKYALEDHTNRFTATSHSFHTSAQSLPTGFSLARDALCTVQCRTQSGEHHHGLRNPGYRKHSV